jgi:hypothetical protein
VFGLNPRVIQGHIILLVWPAGLPGPGASAVDNKSVIILILEHGLVTSILDTHPSGRSETLPLNFASILALVMPSIDFPVPVEVIGEEHWGKNKCE